MQARIQDFLKGGGEAPPLGHCPRDVIRPPKNCKTPPLLDIHKHPPPLDIARVTSSTFQGGGGWSPLPLPGSATAMKEWVKMGRDIGICTVRT